MNKEIKDILVEIISLLILLIIVVPVCVYASSRYVDQKEVMLTGIGTSVDITNNGDLKKITIYSNYDKLMKVNLIMKINKVVNNYEIYLDGIVYDISDFNSYTDDSYNYYVLGVYDVLYSREFDFELRVKGNVYYDETIIYSFVTKGIL